MLAFRTPVSELRKLRDEAPISLATSMQDLYEFVKFQNGTYPRNKGKRVLAAEIMAESPAYCQ